MKEGGEPLATISSTIELYDKVSAPIYKILGALGNLTDAFESVETSMDGGFDASKIEESRRAIEQAALQVVQTGEEIRQNENHQKRFNREVDEGALSMSNLAKKAAGIAATIGFGKMVTEAVDFASDLNEVQNVVDVTFGESTSKKVDKWATKTLDAFGLNELSAKQYAGTMGAMLKSSGLTGDSVAEMSMRLAELSGDMASFYNLQSEEAFTKIRSGISGETEPLKQLGINMSVANLEAYALSQGMTTAYSEMSQAEQVMLRYNYLLKATADAQGDFTNTSHSFANQQKLLAENWKAFTGELAGNVLPILTGGLNILNNAVGFMADNWSILFPIIAGVVGILGVYLAVTKGVVLWQTITNGVMTAFRAIQTFVSIGFGVLTGNTAAASAAQFVYNSALLACPLTWILILIIAVVAILYAVIAVINKVTGKTISATGIIVGALMAAVAFIWNLFLGLLDLVLGIINHFWNYFAAFANFFANLFTDPIGSIIHLFGDMADLVLGIIETIAKALDKVFGSNLAGTVQGWRSGLDSMVEKAANKHGNGSYEKVANELNLSSESLGLKRWAYSDAYNTGYDWGANLGSSVSDAFDTNGMTEDIATTAENTEKMTDSLDITNEDLKYLKDLAERDVINRFTTAEIKVDMTNNNSIGNNMDLDGVVNYLVVGVNEAMATAAEGVYV